MDLINQTSPLVLRIVATSMWIALVLALVFIWWFRVQLHRKDETENTNQIAILRHRSKVLRYADNRNTRLCARLYEEELARLHSQIWSIRRAGLLRRIFKLF